MDNPYLQGDYRSDSELGQLYKIHQEGNLNPYQRQRFEQLSAAQGINPGESFGDALTRRQTEANMKAVQPAVTSLEAGIPEVREAFTNRQDQLSAEKDPLKARYDQLLDEIRGRETSQVNDVTKLTNREMGRRGIALSSTFAGEETLGRTAPIRSQAQSDILTTTFDRESKLRQIDNDITNLTSEMVAAERDIRNSIAQIQATAGTAGVAQAVELFKDTQAQRQAALDRLLKDQELDASIEAQRIENEKLSTEVIEVGGRKLLINKQTGETIRDLGASGSGGTGSAINITGGTPETKSSVSASSFLQPTASLNVGGGGPLIKYDDNSGGLINSFLSQQAKEEAAAKIKPAGPGLFINY